MKRVRLLIWTIVVLIAPFIIMAGIEKISDLTRVELLRPTKIVIGVVVVLGCLGGAFGLFYNVWPKCNLFCAELETGFALVTVRKREVRKVHFRPPPGFLVDKKTENVFEIKEKKGAVSSTRRKTKKRKAKKKTKRHFFGGLVFFWWPLDNVYSYPLSWVSVGPNGEPKPHLEEILDRVSLRVRVYIVQIEDAEDMDLIPLRAKVLLTLRVMNPRKALFAVDGWLRTIESRIRTDIRNALTRSTFEKLIQEKEDIGAQISGVLSEANVLQDFKDEYGVFVITIGVEDITLDPDYRKKILLKWEAEKKAAADLVEATLIAKKTFLALGGVYALIREFLRDQGVDDDKAHEMAKELTIIDVEAKAGALLDLRVRGADGVERSLLNMIGAGIRLFQGGGGAKGPKTKPPAAAGETKAGAPSPRPREWDDAARLRYLRGGGQAERGYGFEEEEEEEEEAAVTAETV